VETVLNLNTPLNHTRNMEIECSRKDHSTIFIEILFNYLASEKLVFGTVKDLSEKKQIQKNIVKAIIQTEEKERAYFSKELHDGLGPLLSLIKLYLQWTQRPKSNKSRAEIILKAENIIDDALSTVNEISNKLSPHVLTYYGLTPAVQNFVDRLGETSVIRVEFVSNAARRLDVEIEAALYRAIIECINNTIKYASANNIYILLNDSGKQFQVQYKDDGIGFDIPETLSHQKGLGLFNLQNRIQTIGGKITMSSQPGQGVDYQIVVNL
jgi:signal transduction histidine kinase